MGFWQNLLQQQQPDLLRTLARGAGIALVLQLSSVGLKYLVQVFLALFGSEFATACWELTILSLGQLVNAGAGSVGYLLIMTGHQNQSARVLGCSALLNIILNAIAIPLLGTLGAAIATATTMALCFSRQIFGSLSFNCFSSEIKYASIKTGSLIHILTNFNLFVYIS